MRSTVAWKAAIESADAVDEPVSKTAVAVERKKNKQLERELGRKDKALAETAALLVISKKVAAIFNKAEDE